MLQGPKLPDEFWGRVFIDKILGEPGGLHSKRPRTARPDPTQASQPESQPGGATVTKPAASARSAAAAAAAATTTGFPSSPGPRARPLPS